MDKNSNIFSAMDQNKAAGQLKVGYYPCDSTGLDEPADEALVEEPEELLG